MCTSGGGGSCRLRLGRVTLQYRAIILYYYTTTIVTVLYTIIVVRVRLFVFPFFFLRPDQSIIIGIISRRDVYNNNIMVYTQCNVRYRIIIIIFLSPRRLIRPQRARGTITVHCVYNIHTRFRVIGRRYSNS